MGALKNNRIELVFLAFVILALFQNCSEFQSSSIPIDRNSSSSSEELAAENLEIIDDQTTPLQLEEGAQTSPVSDQSQLECGITKSRLDAIRELLDEIVDQNGPEQLLASALNPVNYPPVIYDIQELTAGVLKAGENCQDIFIIDKLAQLYSVPFRFLKRDSEGNEIWMGPGGSEVLLYSTQFLYAVAKLINIIAHIDPQMWTENMKAFMNRPRAILKAHFERWLFKKSVHACFGVDKNFATFPEYVDKKFHRLLGGPSYCNSLWEPELWIAAAGIEYLAATDWVGLSPQSEQALTEYVQSAVKLFESRLSTRDACPDGRCVGLLLDVGGWKGHPEYPSDLWPIGGEVWDFSHMRRIVQWVDAFYLHREISKAQYSTHEGMVALLSNELAYQVFNRDFKDPAFTNFWNGWAIEYRGIEPRGLSSSYYRAGYGFWAQYRSEIVEINNALLDLIESQKESTYMTPGGKPPAGNFDLLNFYSSLTIPPNNNH